MIGNNFTCDVKEFKLMYQFSGATESLHPFISAVIGEMSSIG